MYLLRRTAARAISSSPSKTFFVQPRSITTFTPAFRSRQQQWVPSAFQKRFASEDAIKTESAEAAAAEAENFAQTTPEAPVEENLTPAQASAEAPAQDASATITGDALDAAAEQPRGPGHKNPFRPKDAAPPNKVVYVGNLYYEVTEEQIKRVFSRFGELESVRIVQDNRGLSRGFAYVEFADINSAQSAVENLDMQVFEGRNLVVQFHRPRTNAPRRDGLRTLPTEPTKTLFIGNMSYEMSDKDLNDLFKDIRNVMDVRVAIDRRTGQPRGFAHADFVDVMSATKAKDVLGEKVIYGRKLRIDFSQSSKSNDGPRGAPRESRE